MKTLNNLIALALSVAAGVATAQGAEIERHTVNAWRDGQLIEIARSLNESGHFKERVCVTKPGEGKECADVDKKVQGAELQCLMARMKLEQVRSGGLLRAAPASERTPAHFRVSPCGT